jgi:predicted metal-dependent hydrolase
MRVIDVGGRLVELEIRRSNRVRGSRIVVRPGYPPELVVRPRADAAEVDAALNEHLPWLERQLARTPEARLGLDRLRLTEAQGEAAALGVEYRRITLRDQRSRWGSCSANGTLSFNWRLVLAPHDVLDYVVVHEVCHLVEHNHGAGFWRLVERRRPGYREPKEWLHEFGWEILAYRAPRDAEAAA